MVGPSFIDDIDCGNFFDHIDDLIVFPEEANNENGGFVGGESLGSFPSLWPEPPELFPGSQSVYSGTKTSSASDLSAELSLPYEEIVQMEWLSNFVEDSFSGGDSMTMDKDNTSVNKLLDSTSMFLSTSPISVLENSSSSSSLPSKTLSSSPEIGLAPTCRGRARSKRPRPPTFNPRPAIKLMPAPIPLPVATRVVSESESIAESSPLMMIPIPGQNKKKKMEMQMANRAGETVERQDEIQNENTPPAQAAVRKCLHCEITKTPQWRLGPKGPKTLCNACGVRYKSGRLYPEYRPAASPTFVPSLHSNSHKRVLEMRNKVDDPSPISLNTAIASAQPELIPNVSPLVDYV